jgi:hypothetical protein
MFQPNVFPAWLAALVATLVTTAGQAAQADDAVRPKDGVIRLFNGKNLDGLYTWLKDTKYEDPRKIFTVENGLLHILGNDVGYVATRHRYRDYHLVVEYRWGEKTWAGRVDRARDSGVIVHCVEPDGSYGQGTFMAGIEAQIIEGGTGDFIVVPGERADGSKIEVALTAETAKDRNGETVWHQGGERKTLNSGRINWFGRDPDWADKRGFRGRHDVQSPGQQWTRLEVLCDGGHIVQIVNGVQVNEGFDSVPSSGKILLQTELAEVYYRRFELYPLGKVPKLPAIESSAHGPRSAQ